MKVFAILLIFGGTLVFCLPLEKLEASNDTSVDGWFVPQLDGSLKWMTTKEAENAERIFSMTRLFGRPKIKFYLYTQENPDEPHIISIDDVSSFSSSNFNSHHPTRFIIHGWQNDYLSDVNVEIRNAFLDTMECNVIVVDWSHTAKSLNYLKSKSDVPKVGKKVAEMIDFLASESGMSLDDLHVIGHSLGAHAAGYAGKHVTSGQIHTIIGLDPAWPLYNLLRCSKRLCETDAMYVEAIHTNGGVLGFLNPVGKADFYVGGGVLQPGCGLDVGGVCSHLRAYFYYAESIRENLFKSKACSHWSLAVSYLCSGESTPVKLGSPTNYLIAEGYYYTPVNPEAPFGLE